ncbi:uncharacterized protein LOC120167609 [Hibiscus syriacus]|uniref:uncharacterized protein LOC120167609 n=1 Tax=Hibiscus syriacus TaxID=106335 RepID=UPI0019250C81|nr:uncharacterized protein LOC120167609 [Hibiscus syriacus]
MVKAQALMGILLGFSRMVGIWWAVISLLQSVPKALNVCMAKDFRPVSCCIVVYKTITRIITTRLSHIFSSIISPSQTTFVKGRNIVDNTLLDQEIVKGYSWKSLSPRCAIKIDLQKAFDYVNWDFLMVVLEAVGLPVNFCSWIRPCVTSSQFSVSLNGSLVGYFRGARGVRQRDPLSLYLFVLVMNVLSSLLDVSTKKGIFRSIGVLSWFHGCFEYPEGFYKFSDLRLNAQKTKLYACGLSDSVLQQIQSGTGFRVGMLPVKYLGVSLVTRKLTSKDCSALVTKIKEKLCKWSNRKLSFGDRLQLIKYVMFNIFSYWSRQLILPKGVISDVERLCMRFFWKGCDFPAKRARVSWNQICYLKSEGGLGLRSLVDWKACCLKILALGCLFQLLSHC